MYILTCQYFGRIKKNLSRRKVELHSADFLWFELRRQAIKGKSEGSFYDVFSLYTRVSLPNVPITSFGPMALRNKVECQ